MTPLLDAVRRPGQLIGGAMTLQSFSIPFVTFIHEVEGIVDFSDFMAGFVKSFVFAILIAGIGCLRGLQTSAGASAVGDAATRAVVSGIILLVVVDGIFAVALFLPRYMRVAGPSHTRRASPALRGGSSRKRGGSMSDARCRASRSSASKASSPATTISCYSTT